MSRIDEFSHQLGALAESARRAEADRERDRRKLDEIANQIRSLSLDVAEDRAVTATERATLGLERAETRRKLEVVDQRLAKIEPVVTGEVETLKGEVGKLKEWRVHVAKIVAVAATVISGAAWLIWEALSAFSGDIRAAIGRLFN